MSDTYRISTNVSVEDVIHQLRAIASFPCMVHIYDRVMKVSSWDECQMLIHGVEVGSYITEDRFDEMRDSLNQDK